MQRRSFLASLIAIPAAIKAASQAPKNPFVQPVDMKPVKPADQIYMTQKEYNHSMSNICVNVVNLHPMTTGPFRHATKTSRPNQDQ